MSQSPDEKYEEREPRRDLHIDEERREMFESLQNSEDSPFFDAANHDLFMSALGYGQANTMPEKIKNEKSILWTHELIRNATSCRRSGLQYRRNETSAFFVISAWSTRLQKKYANAGIDLLHGRVSGHLMKNRYKS